ncbi:MAG: GNAT family N-acetyltransferase [Acholeplasmataceae bacterium]|nr:GNAT family N-acetyltransferase [Acholeplasmataceae bacterium]
MIYHEDNHLLIRDMTEDDIHLIDQALLAQEWEKRTVVLTKRLELAHQGEVIAMVAIIKPWVAGMIFLYPNTSSGPFRDMPFIEDLLVFKPNQGQHIASCLMDVAEDLAKGYHDRIGLAVGLHEGYGKAQVLYAKRGYAPSGDGIWYQDQVALAYDTVTNDDHLVLVLSKQLGSI